jgi:hypothetical protein
MAVSEEAQAVKDFRRRLDYNMRKVCATVDIKAHVERIFLLCVGACGVGVGAGRCATRCKGYGQRQS